MRFRNARLIAYSFIRRPPSLPAMVSGRRTTPMPVGVHSISAGSPVADGAPAGSLPWSSGRLGGKRGQVECAEPPSRAEKATWTLQSGRSSSMS